MRDLDGTHCVTPILQSLSSRRFLWTIIRTVTVTTMSDSPSPSAPLVLHIWPAHGQALSLDPASAAALLYLQLAIPGRFSVAHCANPDVSPSGRSVALVLHWTRCAQLTPGI